MASAGVNMPGEGDSAGPECRLRLSRRRRVAMRRQAATAADEDSGRRGFAGGTSAGAKRSRPVPSRSASPSQSSSTECSSSSSPSPSPSEGDGQGAQVGGVLPEAAATAAAVWPVAFGSVSLAGRMREMEDTVSVRPSFFVWADGSPMHFFAVFDGHGGPHVSALCRDQMHVILAEELAAEATAGAEASAAAESSSWRSALSRCFARVDELASRACACGRVADPPCRCELSGQTGAIIGSTAIVAVLVRDRLVVANCGDSRAVLCRAGAGVPLSSDHKPDRPDEKVRIEAAGGRVVYLNGARVRGILAMSRAIGDEYLKPEVICDPEITITERTIDDDCLILASDGMWDVISNETACDVARQCLEDGNPPGNPAAGSGEAAPSCSSAAAAVSQESDPCCCRAARSLPGSHSAGRVLITSVSS